MWPEGWRDSTGYGRDTVSSYVTQYGYHTGADLNWKGGGNTDLGMPVYSAASGTVTFQADLRPWGNVTVIRHDPLKSPTGQVVYSRYGHMQNVKVNVGERIKRGQQIGEIGTGNGRYLAHLHFDISPTEVLTRCRRLAGDGGASYYVITLTRWISLRTIARKPIS
jgi:murein DD-endopeptidase MepM/ murein hydrolase activator NlpD